MFLRNVSVYHLNLEDRSTVFFRKVTASTYKFEDKGHTYFLTYLLTYLLNPWSRVLFEKLTGFQLIKKFPAFYGTRLFITPIISARSLTVSQNNTFLRWSVVSTSPNPQAGGLLLVGCPWLLIQYIRSYPPYRRPFLHPQPEDAPCFCDRDPPVTDKGRILPWNVACFIFKLEAKSNMFFRKRGNSVPDYTASRC